MRAVPRLRAYHQRTTSPLASTCFQIHRYIQLSYYKCYSEVILVPTIILDSRASSLVSAVSVDCHLPVTSRRSKMGQYYKEIAAIALQRRESAIPRDLLLPEELIRKVPRNLTTVPQSSGHFTPKELRIIETDAAVILLNIKQKIWTSLDVTKAFCKSAAVAQQLVCPAPRGEEFH